MRTTRDKVHYMFEEYTLYPFPVTSQGFIAYLYQKNVLVVEDVTESYKMPLAEIALVQGQGGKGGGGKIFS